MDASALVEQANERSDLASYVFCQFQKFDADHSGYLGFRELGQALRALFKEAGLKRTPDFGALEESFDTADTDGDNKVSLDEFVAWYNHTVEWTRRLHDEAVTEVRSRKHTVYAPHSSALPSTSSPPAPPVCPLPQVTEAKKRPPLLGQSSLSSKSTKVLFDLKMQRIGGTRRTRRTRLFLSSPQLAAPASLGQAPSALGGAPHSGGVAVPLRAQLRGRGTATSLGQELRDTAAFQHQAWASQALGRGCQCSTLEVPSWQCHSSPPWPPGAGPPGSWLRCKLGRSHRAAQGATEGYGAIVRPGRRPPTPRPTTHRYSYL